MTVSAEVRRTTAAPEEVTVRLVEGTRMLELTLDDATALALDVLELAYAVRAGDPVPVFLTQTLRQTESPRYRKTARAYAAVEPRIDREVSINFDRLSALGRTGHYRNNGDVLVPVTVARVLGQRLTVAARESAVGIYERRAV